MNTKNGLVNIIILIIIAVFLVSLFGVSLRDIGKNGTIKDNFIFLKDVTVDMWNNYLKRPFVWVWNNIFTPFILNPINNWISKENTA